MREESDEMKLSTRRYKDWLVNTKLAYSCWPSGASNKTIFKWIDKAFKAGYEKGCDDAYQEQQKKIDEVNSILSNWDLQDSSIKYGGNYMLDQLLKIQELLK